MKWNGLHHNVHTKTTNTRTHTIQPKTQYWINNNIIEVATDNTIYVINTFTHILAMTRVQLQILNFVQVERK